MKETRLERINSEIKKSLSDIFSKKINDPRVSGIISVANVAITNDLSHCKIDLSIFAPNNDKQKEQQTFDVIVSMTGFIRKELAQKIDLRIMPELHFRMYTGFDESEKINKLLQGLNMKSEE